MSTFAICLLQAVSNLDEIWSFVGAKAKNVPAEHKTDGWGDAWTWTAIDADTKLVPCWMVGTRTFETAKVFIADLASRLSSRVQLSTDGHRPASPVSKRHSSPSTMPRSSRFTVETNAPISATARASASAARLSRLRATRTQSTSLPLFIQGAVSCLGVYAPLHPSHECLLKED